MDIIEAEKLVQQLTVGFEALQDEYKQLHAQHQALERKLATARDQYNELAKLRGSEANTTPPLSLSSSTAQRLGEKLELEGVVDILEHSSASTSKDAAIAVKAAIEAADMLRPGLPRPRDTAEGVKIWSGRSADRLDSGSRTMPLISESPLEQDFTIEGKPSSLGCPFASMANKRLSSHAASVLGRYNQGSTGGAPSTPLSSVSRVNGKESFSSRKGERPFGPIDPIKAEICGLSDHDAESPYSERAVKEQYGKVDTADVGVCPIRFLDQHSPEEVATYFERHKHELPRSHEICVRRYQSNEKQIRELDAKYGTIVSMIQGLGAKHKDFLPKEPEEGDANIEHDGKSVEKVRIWASSVSAQAMGAVDDEEVAAGERVPRFDRNLREIRVGESPSRPWGIHVPNEFLDDGDDSQVKMTPAEPPLLSRVSPEKVSKDDEARKCPFGFEKNHTADVQGVSADQPSLKAKPAYITPDDANLLGGGIFGQGEDEVKHGTSQIILTGPVFIGYSAEDAAKILKSSGLGAK